MAPKAGEQGASGTGEEALKERKTQSLPGPNALLLLMSHVLYLPCPPPPPVPAMVSCRLVAVPGFERCTSISQEAPAPSCVCWPRHPLRCLLQRVGVPCDFPRLSIDMKARPPQSACH